MSFVSLTFLVFAAVVLLLMKIVRNRTAQHIILLIASYVFYITFDWRFLFLLIGMSVLMWLIGKGIADRKQQGRSAKGLITVGVVIALAVLGFFKYCNFFVESFCTVFGLETTTLSILLPIGVSFYTFQAISYICDVNSGKAEADSLLHVLLYIGFFPQIVSGPIVKAHDFLPQLQKNVEVNKNHLSEGIQLFIVGLFRKVVIADRLGVCVTAVFAAPAAYSGLSLALASLAFTLQIYCDFAGYSDMAIGVAKCMGFDLGQNFNMPYIARNPSDFWRRWHISLSSWFRDYVYIPLGGNRKGKARTYINLFLTMLLSGLWHGASWTFVFWGALHGIWSAGHRAFKKMRGDKNCDKVGAIVSTILTFCVVSILWIVFKADSFETAWVYISRMFTMADGIKYYFVFVPIYAIIIFGTHLYATLKNDGNSPVRALDVNKFVPKLVLCMMCLIILCFGYFGDSAFLYAQF